MIRSRWTNKQNRNAVSCSAKPIRFAHVRRRLLTGRALLPPLMLAQLALDHRLHRTGADDDVAGYFVAASSKLSAKGQIQNPN